MIKVGYDSLSELSVAFEKYAENYGLLAWHDVTDFMCTVCQIDKYEGSNKQSMTIEKLVTADDEFWTSFVQDKLGLTVGSYPHPLPRVQKERLILDYMLWVVYVKIKNGKMPCYCCESTPKAIDRATDAEYRSEEELKEVYTLLNKEFISKEKFAPSEKAVNMLLSAAVIVKVLSSIRDNSLHSDNFDIDLWSEMTFKRTSQGSFCQVKMLLPNSLLDAHNGLRLIGDFCEDAEFFSHAEELRDTTVFELYAKQYLSSLIHHVVKFAYKVVRTSYSTNEFNANYIMNRLITQFKSYLPIGTLSLDNLVPTVMPPTQMHTFARGKCEMIFSTGNDMCERQSIIGLFGLLSMFTLKKGNTTVTPEQIQKQLGMEYGFWRW